VRVPFPNFDPVIFHLGPLAIRWYALAYIAGILLGWRYCVLLVRNAKLWGEAAAIVTPTQIDDLVLWITVGIIVGGRLGSVLVYGGDTYLKDPLEAFKIWHGGMSFHGGLVGVAIALLAYSRLNKLDALRLGDLIAPCAPIGLFFGRIANFINGELWGRTTDVPWAIVFCNPRIIEANGGDCPAGLAPRHPSQLYEAALEGLVLFLILRWATHKARWLPRPGAVTGLFLLCYGLFRIALENVRQPDAGLDHLPLGLTMGIILSTPMVLVGIWLIRRGLRRPPVAAAPEAPPEEPAPEPPGEPQP
jgi:phosphatidylglycerol:prolipoprotein diacylglycerol transferase